MKRNKKNRVLLYNIRYLCWLRFLFGFSWIHFFRFFMLSLKNSRVDFPFRCNKNTDSKLTKKIIIIGLNWRNLMQITLALERWLSNKRANHPLIFFSYTTAEVCQQITNRIQVVFVKSEKTDFFQFFFFTFFSFSAMLLIAAIPRI